VREVPFQISQTYSNLASYIMEAGGLDTQVIGFEHDRFAQHRLPVMFDSTIFLLGSG